MGELRILTSMSAAQMAYGIPKHLLTPGDTKVIFDSKNKDEVAAAKDQFKSLIKKGFTAYTVGKDHKKNEKVTKFDKSEGKYIMVPPVAGG